MFLGLWPAAGFFPPPLPSADAEQTMMMYQGNSMGIRIGGLLIMLSGALYLPFVASIAAQVRRIEASDAPALSYTVLAAGTSFTMFFVLPGLVWVTAAFRPERSADVTQMLNDMGWLLFICTVAVACVQSVVLGLAILADGRQPPVFPRWVGFFNLWLALVESCGQLAALFKTGPFAWNGLVSFWLPLCLLGPWFFVMSIGVMKAAKRQAADARTLALQH
jgi:hypothetical protein